METERSVGTSTTASPARVTPGSPARTTRLLGEVTRCVGGGARCEVVTCLHLSAGSVPGGWRGTASPAAPPQAAAGPAGTEECVSVTITAGVLQAGEGGAAGGRCVARDAGTADSVWPRAGAGADRDTKE